MRGLLQNETSHRLDSYMMLVVNVTIQCVLDGGLVLKYFCSYF